MVQGERSGGRSEAGLGAPGAARPRCEVWGVINVTPDSFSDGGRFLDPAVAFAHARRLLEEGADVLDVGGASSRPAGRTYGAGAPDVSVREELRRVVPVIERVAGELGARVSVDTIEPEVARAALDAGARIVNDVSGGRAPGMLALVAERGASIVLMHNRDRGEVSEANAAYGDVVTEVVDELRLRVEAALRAGVRAERIYADPGIGFAKTAAHSAELVARVGELVERLPPLLVGTSRKSFIGALAPLADGRTPAPDARAGGTAATATLCVLGGVRALRVHDVAQMRQAIRVAEALRDAAARAAEARAARAAASPGLHRPTGAP